MVCSEKIVSLKDDKLSIIWAKNEVILIFSTFDEILSWKTPLSKYKEWVLHIIHQVLMTMHWLNLKKSSSIKVYIIVWK